MHGGYSEEERERVGDSGEERERVGGSGEEREREWGIVGKNYNYIYLLVWFLVLEWDFWKLIGGWDDSGNAEQATTCTHKIYTEYIIIIFNVPSIHCNSLHNQC